jgi:hypothetical protein
MELFLAIDFIAHLFFLGGKGFSPLGTKRGLADSVSRSELLGDELWSSSNTIFSLGGVVPK